MIKKAIMLCLVFTLCATLTAPGPVSAQSGPTITSTSAEAEYPFLLHFNLSAESDEEITDIRLLYSLERDSYARVTSEIYIDFPQNKQVDVTWTWDMRQTGGLPPGAAVGYRWKITNAEGTVLETETARIRFEDTRFTWRTLTEGEITLHWYQGSDVFASDLMDTAQTAVDRLTTDTGAYLKKPVSLYIYANAADLQGALIFPQEWTGGVAYTEYGIIAIGISPNNLVWGERAVAHELSHLVVHQMTYNPYTWLPTWLEEGLATYNEGEIMPSFESVLEKAVTDNTLITVRSLSSSFSAFADEAILSYAQSQSIVDFLISEYGQEKMLELLVTFSRGSGYDNALESVYGFDMDGLNDLWQKHVFTVYRGAGAGTASLEFAPLKAN